MTWPLALKIGLLAYCIGTAVKISLRGKVRLGFARQIFDHSLLLAPFNALFYWFSSVPNKPFIATEHLEDLKVLKANWQMIREEAQQLYAAGHITKAKKYNDIAFNSFFKRGWTRFYFHWYGQFFPSAERWCPRTVALMRQLKSVNASMLALLPPGGRLGKHRDPFAGSLRYHLGLVTPNDDDCHIFVDGQAYAWRDGEDVLFDQTFVHHAENQTEQPRIILFCDVVRPIRFFPVRWLNKALSFVLGRATVTANVPGERVGLINRLFSYVFYIRVGGNELKRVNRPLYYATKYVVFFGIFYWLFL